MFRSKHLRKFLLVILLGCVLGGGLTVLRPDPTLAHTRIEAGPYGIVVGWENEPVIVGERNAVWLQILDGEVPVAREVKVDLEATVFYGGHSFLGFPAPAPEPGIFLMDMFPTVRGTYELQLTGTIGDTAVDVIVDLDEIQPASALQFPENQPDPLTLQTQLEETQAQLRTANLIAIAGLVAGLLGLGVGLFALLRRKA
ncbi:MAG: hypothetical protein HUU38_16515 [Anaerolineales bacterium]|nr:hypothetical protein [Anaerolineales bacterium]